MIAGFSADWVVTAGAAQEEAERMAQEAVVEKLVPICVAQFEQALNKVESLKNLKAKSSWARGEFIEEQGWATIPGSESTNSEIADEGAEKIVSTKLDVMTRSHEPIAAYL
jgi:hypothetical protein